MDQVPSTGPSLLTQPAVCFCDAKRPRRGSLLELNEVIDVRALFFFFLSFFFFFLSFAFSRAAPKAYGGSQARGSNQSCSHRPTPEPQQLRI